LILLRGPCRGSGFLPRFSRRIGRDAFCSIGLSFQNTSLGRPGCRDCGTVADRAPYQGSRSNVGCNGGQRYFAVFGCLRACADRCIRYPIRDRSGKIANAANTANQFGSADTCPTRDGRNPNVSDAISRSGPSLNFYCLDHEFEAGAY